MTNLRTLGGLDIEGISFGREKPLLLLAYLSIEGPKYRRFLADLFWPGAADAMNSLAVALSKLRKLEVASADANRAWVNADTRCDVVELREHLRGGRLEEGVGLYRGPFAEGLKEALEEELEEWMLETRESIATEVRGALIELAERKATTGDFAQAAARAEAAYRLAGGAPVEPEDLPRLYRLLRSADHPAHKEVEREAKELGVQLETSTEEARGRLRQSMVGRKREMEVLLGLEPGEWAWVRGGSGMGKTTLLREVAAKGHWFYMPGRSGLPFATLEPLVERLEGGEEAVVRRLTRVEDNLLIDNWGACDVESRQVLARLRSLRPAIRVVVADSDNPPFTVEKFIDLGPLSKADLVNHPGLFELGGGLPILVGAALRGEPVEAALEGRLLSLPPDSRTLFLALALLEEPDLVLVRKGLGWGVKPFASAYETLIAAGLIETSGKVRARLSAQTHLEAEPIEVQTLALQLARISPPLQAFSLYQKSRTVWEETDLNQVSSAYLEWAKQLLRRGYPAKAIEVLDEAPVNNETMFQKGRALERSGKYQEALELFQKIPVSPEVQGIQSALLWRLGMADKAHEAAKKAIKGSLEAGAEGNGTLAKLSFSAGDLAQAERYFGRAANLWAAVGERGRRAEALSNQAVARSELGEHAEIAFAEALQAAEDYPPTKALVLSNMAMGFGRIGDYQKAIKWGTEGLELASAAGVLDMVAGGLYNVGAWHYLSNNPEKAREEFTQALELAQQLGDKLTIGVILFDLAKLDRDPEAGEKALAYLQENGFEWRAEQRRVELEMFKPRSDVRQQN